MESRTSPPLAVALTRSLASSDNPTYVLSRRLRIVHVNDAWTRFAHANDGADVIAHWGRGTSVLEATSGELRDFYRERFEAVLHDGQRWEHDYECSSPEMFRRFRMIAFPAEGSFLVVTNSLQISRPHERAELPPDDVEYVRDGVILMCANCRRVRAAKPAERWDWVPEYVRTMRRNTSHGLCPPCACTYGVTDE